MKRRKRYVSKKRRHMRRKRISPIQLLLYPTMTLCFACAILSFFARPSEDMDVPHVRIIESDPEFEELECLAANPEEMPGVYPCTEEEKELFMKVISAEGYSFWNYSDYLSLVTVVLNRYESSDFPDNFHDILMSRKQFEVVGNGRYLDAEITEECRLAVEDGLNGKRNLNHDVLWFCSRDYYENCGDDDFFKTLEKVYACRNIYFFEE